MVLSLMYSRVQIGVSGVRRFNGADDVRTGVNFRLVCDSALHGGAATLTGCALNPRHWTYVKKVDIL